MEVGDAYKAPGANGLPEMKTKTAARDLLPKER